MELPPEAVFSVSEFLDLTNQLLGQRDFSVQGEVSKASVYPSGLYLTLKDHEGNGLLECYVSPYVYRAIGVTLEEGALVKVRGTASVYKPKGKFSFRVDALELAGEGSLKKVYEALKKKLTEEGLFDRKRPLPEFVTRVGLITSKTGAVIGDFRKNLARLGIQITHYDVRVEGMQAVGQVRRALEWFNAHADTVDVIVLIRGGGSWEDLAAFNDESVVRGVFASRVPSVVSIGHDRDVPLAQMAADASASTPTATAHLVNGTWDRLRHIGKTAQRISFAYENMLSSVQADIAAHGHRIGTYLARIAGAADHLSQRLAHGLAGIGLRIAHVRELVVRYEQHLGAASPERQLGLGYAIVTDPAGAVVRDIRQLRQRQEVTTRLAKGSFVSEVKELQSE